MVLINLVSKELPYICHTKKIKKTNQKKNTGQNCIKYTQFQSPPKLNQNEAFKSKSHRSEIFTDVRQHGPEHIKEVVKVGVNLRL